MKKYTYIALLMGCTALAQTTPNFKGTFVNAEADSIVVKSLLGKFRKAIAVDKRGDFSATIQQGMNLFSMEYGKQQMLVFLSNDMNLTLLGDADDLEKTIHFDGEGAAENNFVKRVNLDTKNIEAKIASSANSADALTGEIEATVADWRKTLKEDTPAVSRTSLMMLISQQSANLKLELINRENRAALTGKPSPLFSYKDVKGKTVNLADFKGKYVYIDVWATWCGPCRQEIPHLQKLEEQFKGSKIAFISLSIDEAKDADKWKKMVAEKSLGGVQVMADNAWKSDFVKAYSVESIPRFILIDPKGNIVDPDAKRPSEPELAAQLKKLLGK